MGHNHRCPMSTGGFDTLGGPAGTSTERCWK
jgi:hypothetical protein